jgi:ABC-type sugar transport system permease subunit
MWTINIFDLQLIMTNGGPLNSTTTASLFMYKQAFEQGKMSLGATVGIILLAINLCISFVYLKLLRSERA